MRHETVGTGRQLVSFGKAIEAMRNGKRIQRQGWNGKGLFVFMQVPASVPISIVPKMSSLPQSVKDEFKRRLEKYPEKGKEDMDIRYRNQFALVHSSNEINGWAPSSSDTLAEDWIVLD
jgi:hypothetical protein